MKAVIKDALLINGIIFGVLFGLFGLMFGLQYILEKLIIETDKYHFNLDDCSLIIEKINYYQYDCPNGETVIRIKE